MACQPHSSPAIIRGPLQTSRPCMRASIRQFTWFAMWKQMSLVLNTSHIKIELTALLNIPVRIELFLFWIACMMFQPKLLHLLCYLFFSWHALLEVRVSWGINNVEKLANITNNCIIYVKKVSISSLLYILNTRVWSFSDSCYTCHTKQLFSSCRKIVAMYYMIHYRIIQHGWLPTTTKGRHEQLMSSS